MLWLPPEHSRTHLFNKTNSQKKKKKRPTPSLLARGHQPEEKNPSQSKDLHLEPGKGPHRPPTPQGGQHGQGRGCRREEVGVCVRPGVPGGAACRARHVFAFSSLSREASWPQVSLAAAPAATPTGATQPPAPREPGGPAARSPE